jgi:uncharacterized protein YndB with AHSA1/START domain
VAVAATKTPFEFVISRTFDAPRDLVWRAFTEGERMMHWWGPKGFTTPYVKVDLRPGGVCHYQLKSPQGQEMWGKFVYREIVAQERLVFIVSFSDEKQMITTHPLNPNWPREILSTVTFAEHNGKTTMTIRWSPHAATDVERKTFEDGRESMRMGWTGTLDQLEAYLSRAG